MNEELLKTLSLLVAQLDRQMRDIRSHIGLDTTPLSIDYSFISNDGVKRQLERDNREMTKLRSLDFDNFCRFAHYQIEELLNFYFSYRFGNNLQGMRQYFRPKPPKEDSKELNNDSVGRKSIEKPDYESIADLTFSVMFYNFSQENKFLDWHWQSINNISNVRNNISHRDTNRFQLVIQENDWKKLSKTDLNLKNGNIYSLKKDYNEVEKSLRKFAEIIKGKLEEIK